MAERKKHHKLQGVQRNGTWYVQCPTCRREQPLPGDVYEVDAQGRVWPWFVCLKGTQHMPARDVCPYAGPIWLINA